LSFEFEFFSFIALLQNAQEEFYQSIDQERQKRIKEQQKDSTDKHSKHKHKHDHQKKDPQENGEKDDKELTKQETGENNDELEHDGLIKSEGNQ
jgi:hypothetical protein